MSIIISLLCLAIHYNNYDFSCLLHAHNNINTILQWTVYNGHCISRSPLYNSQVAKSKNGVYSIYLTCASRSPLYNSHFWGGHYRQVSLISKMIEFTQITHHPLIMAPFVYIIIIRFIINIFCVCFLL